MDRLWLWLFDKIEHCNYYNMIMHTLHTRDQKNIEWELRMTKFLMIKALKWTAFRFPMHARMDAILRDVFVTIFKYLTLDLLQGHGMSLDDGEVFWSLNEVLLSCWLKEFIDQFFLFFHLYVFVKMIVNEILFELFLSWKPACNDQMI